ncbi:hypothetical protein IFM46972_01804 [Aspergillus udagawae]|uniref:Uncharacterized protein n=1 Tax=Aspergillus udagawae TaxID=91492 RepID=A0A8H3N9Q0_9EURO|nr:hypothetical protein IFM46972_01804 [Aspergillus udagawae]
MPLRHIAITAHHALHLLQDPPPLSQRTLQAGYKKRPEEAHWQVSLRTCRLSRRQLDDLIHSAVDSIGPRINSECYPVQIDENRQKISAYSVGDLQDLKFVPQRPATAMMEVDAHDPPDNLLGLNEEAKCGPRNGVVDKIAWFRQKVIFCRFLVYRTIVHNTAAGGRLSANGTTRFILLGGELGQAAEFNQRIAISAGNQRFHIQERDPGDHQAPKASP